MDFNTAWDWANKGGAILAFSLLVFVAGLLKEVWIMGKGARRELAAAKADADLWRTAFFDVKGIARQSIAIVRDQVKDSSA